MKITTIQEAHDAWKQDIIDSDTLSTAHSQWQRGDPIEIKLSKKHPEEKSVKHGEPPKEAYVEDVTEMPMINMSPSPSVASTTSQDVSSETSETQPDNGVFRGIVNSILNLFRGVI